MESKKRPNDNELQTLMVCAFRYALTRGTYIPQDVADILLNYKHLLQEHDVACIKRDIVGAIQRKEIPMINLSVWSDLLDKI